MSDTMRILALETTGMTGSVALLEDERVVQEIMLRDDQRSAQSLAPAIQEAIIAAGWTLDSVNLIAVAVGPGSFTGLRVGITTAKLLAYILKADVLGLDTLEVLAEQAKGVCPANRIHGVFDAQRNEVFAATFEQRDETNLTRIAETRIISNAAWLASLVPGDAVNGPVLAKLQSQLSAGVLVADTSQWQPRATTIGALARRYYSAGRRDDVWKLAAQYHRASAAEEKAAAKKA